MRHAGPRIAHSAVWNHIGKVVEYALMYFSTVLIARGLGVEGNGTLAGVLSFVQLIVVLSSAGLEVSLNRHLPQAGNASPPIRYLIRRIIATRLAIYAAVNVAAFLLLFLLSPARGQMWAEYLVLVALLGMLRSISPVLGMLLVARFRTAPAATAGVIARGGEVAALLYVGQAMTIPMVLAILVIGSTVQVAGYAFVSRREWFGESSPGPVLPVVMFGVVFWCNTILDYFLGRQGDVMFLTLLCPRASEASLYDVAYSIVQVGLLVLTAGLGGVSLAALSRFAATDRVRMNSLYRVIVRTTSLLTIPLLAFILVRAPDILKLLFSDKYAGAASILRIILGMRILSRLFATGENADYLLALGKVWLVVRIGAIAACVTVGAHLILIPRWGAVGAACAGSAGVLLANIMGGVAVQRIGKIEWQWQAWIRIAAAAMVAGFLSGLIPDCGTPFLTVAATGFVFLIAFVLLATVLRPLYREDIDVINAALGRVALPMRIFARTR